MEFLFERLDAYRHSLDLIESLDRLAESLKGRLPATRLDQLARASLSIPLNIAEGCGRARYAERAHFFVIARGSAYECASLLQIVRRKQLVSDEDYALHSGNIHLITKLLSGLIRHAEMQVKRRRGATG